VAQAEGDENLVVSPFTIAGVLHMLAAGSQGDTRQEIITRGLGLDYKSYYYRGRFNYQKLVESYQYFTDFVVGNGKNYECTVFNGLYHQADSDFKNMDDRKANPDYLSVIQKKYIKKLGEIKEVDFTYNAQSVKNKINKKVEKVTRGKIKNLLSQVDESTLVIVLSAIYFESQWRQPINSHKKPFETVPLGEVKSNPKLTF